jgi:Tol biopolymer transport system component
MVLFQQHSKQGYRIAIHDLERDELEIVSDGLTPAWLPGDAGVLFAKYVGGNSDIYSWKFGAQAPVRLTTDPSRDQYPYAAVIDDEQKIVYASKKDSDYYDIWSMNMDGSQKRRLTYVGEEIGQRMIGPVVSPDGEKIAFWEIDYKNDHSVWIMNVDGTHLQEILKRAANPEFGQDRLYFDSKVTGRAQIWFTTY